MHTLIPLLKNTRPLQIIYHIGLMLIGSGLAILFIPQKHPASLSHLLLLAVTVTLAWISTVYFNDVPDQPIDEISNPHRPLPRRLISQRQSMSIGWVLLVISVLLALFLPKEIVIMLIIYHALSWIYSMPPLRLKRIPLIATFLGACASLTIILCGFFLFAGAKDLVFFPKNIALLLLISYTLCLPLKDLRDIDGDRAHNIKTLPVLLGMTIARWILAGNLLVSFVLSAFFLDKALFVPAIFFGTLSALVLSLRKHRTFIVPVPMLLPIIFTITFFYGALLVWMLFLR